jgi:hypothetical protein
MANWRRRLVGLGVPCLLTWMLDLTLSGQPPEYWAGDYSRTTEAAAFYRSLYTVHPAAGIGGQVLWMGVVAGLLVLLPETLAVVLALAAVFGNTFGASTWVTAALRYRASWGSPTLVNWYQASCGLFLAAAVLAGVGVRWVVRSSARSRDEPRVAGWRKWAPVSILLVAAAAIVFVPW